MSSQPRILVIKHGALGDMIQSLGAFEAIRRHHPQAAITLLTAPAFVSLMKLSPFFNEVVEDAKPSFLSISGSIHRRSWFLQNEFNRVYDLQNSDRTGWYYRLLWPHCPSWSGYVWGCSHPHRTAHRGRLHTLERLQEQLTLAGIDSVPPPSLDWLEDTYIERPATPYALLLLGGAAHRPRKRWPEAGWLTLARALQAHGITPVFPGTEAERASIERVSAAVPGAVNLCAKTTLPDLITLARAACLAVGNDTGPMHIAAVTGCPSLVLFSAASDPKRCGQRGKKVIIEQVDDLQQLEPARVMTLLHKEFGLL